MRCLSFPREKRGARSSSFLVAMFAVCLNFDIDTNFRLNSQHALDDGYVLIPRNLSGMTQSFLIRTVNFKPKLNKLKHA